MSEEIPPDDQVVPEDRTAPRPLEPPTGTTERTDARRAGAETEATAGAAAVLQVARTLPFMSAFNRCAHHRFPQRASDARVARMIEAHPRWYRFCWWADIAFISAACLLLLAAAGGVIYRLFFYPGLGS